MAENDNKDKKVITTPIVRVDTELRNYDLEESLTYASKNARFKKEYRDFYSDIKHDTTEDW